MEGRVTASYAFRDSEVAARRLALLARVFSPSTADFLRLSVIAVPELIIDLGCGPGYTTHLLADLFPHSHVIGLDSSQRFIDLAQHSQSDRIAFHQHDVTQFPFPADPADVLYCRFLVTHLSHPKQVIPGWTAQLRRGGSLLMEEVEAIHTAHPAFVSYLEIVAAMLRHQSNELYIGHTLAAMAATQEVAARLHLRSSGVSTFPVSNADAAGMFALNLQVWRQNPFIQERYTVDQIDELERRLVALTREPSGRSDITWELRQMVFGRA
jgi:trans-aconitate 2-methyltransferase